MTIKTVQVEVGVKMDKEPIRIETTTRRAAYSASYEFSYSQSLSRQKHRKVNTEGFEVSV